MHDCGEGLSSVNDALQRCMTVVRDCLPQLEDIVKGTADTAIVEHGLFIRPGEQVAEQQASGWGKGRVTLIGDAAHPMRPTGKPSQAA